MRPASAMEVTLAAASTACADEAPWDRDAARLAARTAAEEMRQLPAHLQVDEVRELVAQSLLTGLGIGMEIVEARVGVAA